MEAAAAYRTRDLSPLAGFAGFSRSTARQAVPTLETLGILKLEDTGAYTVTVDGVAGASPTKRRSKSSDAPYSVTGHLNC